MVDLPCVHKTWLKLQCTNLPPRDKENSFRSDVFVIRVFDNSGFGKKWNVEMSSFYPDSETRTKIQSSDVIWSLLEKRIVPLFEFELSVARVVQWLWESSKGSWEFQKKLI